MSRKTKTFNTSLSAIQEQPAWQALEGNGKRIGARDRAQGRRESVRISHSRNPLLLPFQTPTTQADILSDLATERERQFRTGKRAKKTDHDFRCPICRSAVGQVEFSIAPAVVTVVTLSLFNLPIQDKQIKGAYLLLNLA